MKFSIRDLMLVTIITAVGTAWWIDRTQLHREISELKKSLEGRVVYTAYPPSRQLDGVRISDLATTRAGRDAPRDPPQIVDLYY